MLFLSFLFRFKDSLNFIEALSKRFSRFRIYREGGGMNSIERFCKSVSKCASDVVLT